jgi:hypothetical protein
MRFVLFALFLAPAVAGATTLSTTFILPTANPGQAAPVRISCNFINVSSKPLDVTISVLDHDGNVIDSTTYPGTTSQQTWWFFPSTTETGSDAVHCVFTFSGSAKSARAAMEVVNAQTSVPLVVLPAT